MDKSPIGKLSGELRNRIYRLLLIFDEPFYFDSTSASEFLYSGLRVRRALPFLSTCKQIRQEASSIFFGENTFVFNSDFLHGLSHSAEMTLIGDWLLQLGHSAKHIRHVVFTVRRWEPWTDDADWKIEAIPARLKALRLLFRGTEATPALKLDVHWSETRSGGRPYGDRDPAIIAEFSDAMTARKSFRETLVRDKAMLARVVSRRRGYRDEDYQSRKDDLATSSRKVGRLVKALESALGS